MTALRVEQFWNYRSGPGLGRSDLPPPEVIAQEIVDDLEAALEQFRLIAGDLGASGDDAAPA